MTILYFQPNECPAGRMKFLGAQAAARSAKVALQIVESAAVDARRVRRLLDFWRPDACIVESGNDVRYCPAEAFAGTPVVFIDRDPASLPPSARSVNIDSSAVGEAAARELMSLGLSHFACLPVAKNVFWARERTAAFKDALELNGRTCDVFGGSARNMAAAVSRWLTTLPRPCGIFAATDRLGAMLLSAIRRIDASVPEDFAVIGVDNDETICENTTPTLSSVAPDFRSAGEMAVAAILNPGDRAVRRKFSTCGVVRRASSFTSKVPTPGLTAALDAIRAHACDGLKASDVAKAMHVSRRLAERRFKDATGKTILKAIHERRLEAARKLVCLSDTPLETIPGLVGWKSATAFREVFRNTFGENMHSMRRNASPAAR